MFKNNKIMTENSVSSQYTSRIEFELTNLSYGIDQTNAEGVKVNADFSLVSRANSIRKIYWAFKESREQGITLPEDLSSKVDEMLGKYLEESKKYFAEKHTAKFHW